MAPSTRRRIVNKGIVVKKKAKPQVKKSHSRSSIATNKKGRRVKCRSEGGTQKGGVCVTHGAKVDRKRCSFVGCKRFSQGKGGVCITHGAKRKYCSFEGCTSYAKKGGVCITHGAVMKRCSHKGCTKQAQKGGVCITHGAKQKRCSIDGCPNRVQKDGVCITHGAAVKRCGSEGCSKYARTGGFDIAKSK
jgi:hypothetical protein